MEEQGTIGFIESCLRVLNSILKHFKFFAVFVSIPTFVAFVLVMWVIKPVYIAAAIVTPPASTQPMPGVPSGLKNRTGMSSLLGISMDNEDANAVWTILNSWEMHDMVIKKFDLARHYDFTGEFYADLLKEFRKKFGLEMNKEEMFSIYYKDTDPKLAVRVVKFVLEKADSLFNAFKTEQARQSRVYFQVRLDSCERAMDSLINAFVDFQVKNNVYEPNVQLEATIKYLSELQVVREEVSMELNFEKLDRGENSKRFQELSKRAKSMNSVLGGALRGKHRDIGMIELKKSPKLYAEYLRRESEIRIQESLYKMLRQQGEQMRMEEAKSLKNLHVLDPPWENNKKIYPLRGITVTYIFLVSCLIAAIVCCIRDYLEKESSRGTDVACEWAILKGFFKKKQKV